VVVVAATASHRHEVILVVGSANADTFLPVERLPTEGENLCTTQRPIVDVPGGKGCTQAVAVSKLIQHHDAKKRTCRFVGQLGRDVAGDILRSTLDQHGVDASHCGFHGDLPSGRGYVFLEQSGKVSAVVSGGSNAHGWQHWKDAWEQGKTCPIERDLRHILEGVQCILLQREVPEYVNMLIASRAKEMDSSIIVCMDVGGEDRPISEPMLRLCDYLVPNESELKRLVQSSCGTTSLDSDDMETDQIVVEYARRLQQMGASNVLVTRGSVGSTLLTVDGQIVHQPAIRLPHTKPVVDETGAGDCYRAAFAVALMEGHDVKQCMRFASAAGSCSVETNGAVPSTPTRSQVIDRLSEETVLDIPRGDGQQGGNPRDVVLPRGGGGYEDDDEDFPFLFGSRLNSMKDRPDLWGGKPLKSPRDYVQRQAAVRGLTCVDFNYPQHFDSWTAREAKKALDEAGLKAGAVCLRYPSEFARGAMNHPSHEMRRNAIDMTKKAAEVARELGTNEVVVWSAFDGYDYPFQVDYDEKWDQLVSAFKELCDDYPSIKFSLEYKPTDENTRFFTVPTTAAALLFVEEVNRPNIGLTLDVGHMLMAGENPGQSIAMVGCRKKLFGVQLNDGFTRLAAEDGLVFGSVHPSMALEIMYQLLRTGFDGHFYFDTFPQRSDPVREAEYNIQQAKKFWYAACSINQDRLRHTTKEHDAISALEIVNDALRGL
jgi:sugar/nucleoside kinase (ribokinase family)/sugar phosphate isomerase/epimerase